MEFCGVRAGEAVAQDKGASVMPCEWITPLAGQHVGCNHLHVLRRELRLQSKHSSRKEAGEARAVLVSDHWNRTTFLRLNLPGFSLRSAYGFCSDRSLRTINFQPRHFPLLMLFSSASLTEAKLKSSSFRLVN